MMAFLKYQKLTLWWALLVLVLCDMKMGGISHSSIFFPGFDKLVHCGFFFVFTVLCCQGHIRQRGRLTFLDAFSILIIAVSFGSIIELVQIYVFTWRSGEWNDLFADTVGASMGIFSALVTLYAYTHENN